MENDEKEITVLYVNQSYTYGGKALDLFHNGDEDGLIFENPTVDPLCCKLYDCLGTLLSEVTVPAESIVRLDLPKVGMIRVNKI